MGARGPESVWKIWKRRHFLNPAENPPTVRQCPACSLVAALTEISRLHIGIYFGTLSLCVCVCVCVYVCARALVYKSSSMVSYQLHLQTDTDDWTKVDQTILLVKCNLLLTYQIAPKSHPLDLYI